ncbi:RNase H domain-containing protein [Trichonephila clavipes]|uniref:RNase H domain-containing protein n=1 Tax=Trichonephila clavipes TaxID=2585209 RepID=A0A8X6W102_TRICX|nr:RNase H domain-containing protein [Trichonephila clavipes]
MWYQHGGAPEHKSAQTCTFLEQTFDTRIIRYGGQEVAEATGHMGIYGNERAHWLTKEATKLSDLIPMSIPKSYHKKAFKEKIISEWNNLYQISNNAHLTKEFTPSIQSRLKAKHFHPNFKLT